MASAVPISDDEDLSASPKRAKHDAGGASHEVMGDLALDLAGRNTEDADAALARMLREAQDSKALAEAPSWAMAMHHTNTTNFSVIKEAVGGLHTRVAALENSALADDPRISNLEQQVKELRAELKAATQHRGHDPVVGETRSDTVKGSEPPQMPRSDATRGPDPLQKDDPWRQYLRRDDEAVRELGPPSPMPVPFSDTNFSRLIVGGWDPDTKRAVIESDCETAIRSMDGLSVQQIQVYGRRARVAHVVLEPLDAQAARERFYRLQSAYSNKLTLQSSGAKLWIAPARTQERRQKNRDTKRAMDLLSALAPDLFRENSDVDWARQVIWLQDRRVAAGSHASLRARPQDTIMTTTFRFDEETGKYSFNGTALAELTNQSEADVEKHLHSI
jgi:hypothetical protein